MKHKNEDISDVKAKFLQASPPLDVSVPADEDCSSAEGGEQDSDQEFFDLAGEEEVEDPISSELSETYDALRYINLISFKVLV